MCNALQFLPTRTNRSAHYDVYSRCFRQWDNNDINCDVDRRSFATKPTITGYRYL